MKLTEQAAFIDKFCYFAMIVVQNDKILTDFLKSIVQEYYKDRDSDTRFGKKENMSRMYIRLKDDFEGHRKIYDSEMKRSGAFLTWFLFDINNEVRNLIVNYISNLYMEDYSYEVLNRDESGLRQDN